MLASLGQRAQRGGSTVRIVLDREEALDEVSHIARQSGARAKRGLLEKAARDFSDRAAADGVDAGDRQQIGYQRVGAFRIRTGKRSQHALILGACVVATEHEAIEVLRQIGLAVEILDEPSLPSGRKIECRNETREQCDVANLDVGRGDAIVRCRLEAERKHLGVGGRPVGASERLDAGLQEFRGSVGAMTKNRTEIAKAGGFPAALEAR